MGWDVFVFHEDIFRQDEIMETGLDMFWAWCGR